LTEQLLKLIKLSIQIVQAQELGLNQTVSAESKMLCQCSIRSPNIPSLQLSTTASKYGKIFFRHSEGHIRDFELQTVTFGVNCAAFLAI